MQVGFVQSKNDYSMYTHGSGQTYVVILLYVDDIILSGFSMSGFSMSVVSGVKDFLSKAFRLKDLGDLKYFLGI